MANANAQNHTPTQTGPYGGQRVTTDQFPKHHVANLTNLHPAVPEQVRAALGVVADYTSGLNAPGRDSKQAASRLSAFVSDLNALVR